MGSVIVGNIGTAERMNYTILGDPVNLAARLEAINKNYKTKILISQKVREQIGERFLLRPIDIVAVKGKIEQVKIYELAGQFDAEDALKPSSEQVQFFKAFETAFDLFQKQELKQAQDVFTLLHQQNPLDYPTELYLKRIQEAMKK